MKLLCLTINFLFSVSSLFAQRKTDYRSARKNLSGLSCDDVDIVALFEVYDDLLELDTTGFKKNMWIYYVDLGMTQYKIGAIRKDSTCNLAAIQSFNSGLKL